LVAPAGTIGDVVDTEVLRNVELFGVLTDEQLAAVAGSASTRRLSRNDVLFTQADTPSELFVVVAGRVAIANRAADGRESVVALMEPGDLFGEMPLFDDLPRSAEARALESSELVVVPYAPLRAIYEAQPQLLWKVVGLLAQRLRATDEALADSVFLDVTGRTAKRILELSGGSDDFHLPVTQEELSGMVGASRERVNKAISSFVRLGWIDQSERHYRIIDRQQLERRAR